MSSSCEIWTLPRFGLRLQGMSSNAQRLADAVKARRLELDRTQLEVHAAGGPSNSTQTLIENAQAETLSRTTARRLDTGLKWAEGSARAVWDGTGDAVPAAQGLSGDDTRWLAEQIEKADLATETRERLLAELAEDARRRGA